MFILLMNIFSYLCVDTTTTTMTTASVASGKSKIYLGVPKRSRGANLFSYRGLEKIVFLYEMIEKKKLYFSAPFHPYSTGIIIIKFR